MKPQSFDISSDALEEFREKMNAALAMVVRQLKIKELPEGIVTGKIKIVMEKAADANGEIATMINMEPEVSLNLSAKGKIECSKKAGLFTQLDENGNPVIGSCQVDIEDLLNGGTSE